MKQSAKIQHGLALKRVNRRYDKILIKMIKQTLDFLEINEDIPGLNNYIESRAFHWFKYCDKFNPENRYSPSPDAYLNNLVRNVSKTEKK